LGSIVMPAVAGLGTGIALVVLFAMIQTSQAGIPVGTIQPMFFSNSTTIRPGAEPIHPCQLTNRVEISILNSTGFSVYNVSRGYSDYVISAGKQGLLTYTMTRNVDRYTSDVRAQLTAMQSYDSNALFIHYVNVTEVQTVTSLGPATLPNGTVMQSYRTCYQTLDKSGGIACDTGPMSKPPANTITLPDMKLDHPGITVSTFPTNVTLGFDEAQTVKLAINVAADATGGTYWLQLGPSMCGGYALVLLTVGDAPYTQIDSEPGFEVYYN
jgi:hypothetical protein